MDSQSQGRTCRFLEVLGEGLGCVVAFFVDFWGDFPLSYAILRYFTLFYLISHYFTLIFDSMISYLTFLGPPPGLYSAPYKALRSLRYGLGGLVWPWGLHKALHDHTVRLRDTWLWPFLSG